MPSGNLHTLDERDEQLTKIFSKEQIKHFKNAISSVKETRV